MDFVTGTIFLSLVLLLFARSYTFSFPSMSQCDGIQRTAVVNRISAQVLTAGSHGSTFGGNFLSTAVGLKVIEIMKNQDICMNVSKVGEYFKKELDDKLGKHKIVEEIRSKGLMIGIELNKECTNLSLAALELGLVINITRNKIIRLLPPLIINKSHVDEIIEKINLLLKEL